MLEGGVEVVNGISNLVGEISGPSQAEIDHSMATAQAAAQSAQLASDAVTYAAHAGDAREVSNGYY